MMRARRTRRMSSFCVAAACSATVNRHFNLAARVALSVRCSATPGEKAAVVPSGTYTCTLGSQRCVWKSRSRAKTEAASRWCTPGSVPGWRCNSTFWPKHESAAVKSSCVYAACSVLAGRASWMRLKLFFDLRPAERQSAQQTPTTGKRYVP